MIRRVLSSSRGRIFLVAWILYSAHFATNVVREHYPAFALAERGTLTLDEYQGFHSDIFVHTNGHSYINNNVFVSTLAAVPLWIFHPALDALEAQSKRTLAATGLTGADYRTDKPLRVAFFRLVKERGLELRFGAATAITTVFFMAPLTALFLVLVYDVLVGRGVDGARASGLALLLGFGTPIFFRTTGLNHNMFVMYFTFLAFVLLTPRATDTGPLPVGRRLLAGLAMGLIVATDYIGVSIVPVLGAYALLARAPNVPVAKALRASWAIVVGALPALAVLWYTQWVMFGHPFLPAQHWMPAGNEFATRGASGFTWPQADLVFQNLFHPGFGLVVWGPLLALAVLPGGARSKAPRVLTSRERWFVAALCVSVLLFSSANQFARLQWNSGFRYLVPLVPFLFLVAADHWRQWPARLRLVVGTAVVLHSWVLTVFREPVDRSWQLFFAEGVELPWYRVFRLTAAPGTWVASQGWVPAVLLAAVLAVAAGIWWMPRPHRVRPID